MFLPVDPAVSCLATWLSRDYGCLVLALFVIMFIVFVNRISCCVMRRRVLLVRSGLIRWLSGRVVYSSRCLVRVA